MERPSGAGLKRLADAILLAGQGPDIGREQDHEKVVNSLYKVGGGGWCMQSLTRSVSGLCAARRRPLVGARRRARPSSSNCSCCCGRGACATPHQCSGC